MRWLLALLGLDRGRVCFDPVADEAGERGAGDRVQVHPHAHGSAWTLRTTRSRRFEPTRGVMQQARISRRRRDAGESLLPGFFLAVCLRHTERCCASGWSPGFADWGYGLFDN